MSYDNYWTVSVSIAEWHKLERFNKNWKHELLCIVRTPATLLFITKELLCVNRKMQLRTLQRTLDMTQLRYKILDILLKVGGIEEVTYILDKSQSCCLR